MTAYDALFSRMGGQLAGSAIRQMGILAAGRPDLISFAPGYPDPATFAWEAYRAIADDLLRERGHDTLQYGPTRGHGPLIETLVPRLRANGIR
jgi:2-aminoadipate transaminase